MNKQALEARAAALQTELNKLREEIAKPALPEGFIAFTPTEIDAPPCHPQDVVSILTQNGATNSDVKEAKRYRWDKTVGYNSNWDIMGYRVVKKYVEPRLMKYSEIPVGQAFTWDCSGKTVYLKIKDNKVAIIKGPEVGIITHFSEENGLKFYAIELNSVQGELLTVPPA